MKKIISSLLILLCVVSLWATDPERIEETPQVIVLEYAGGANNGGFNIWYDELTYQPFVTWYTLTRENANNNPPNKRPSNFHRDDRLVTLLGSSKVATHADYTGSGYDRGHMVLADDFDDVAENLNATFVTSNICPQNSDLNQRGAWRSVELYQQQCAKDYGSVEIFSGPLYIGFQQTFIGGTLRKLLVPTHFFKLIVYTHNNRRVIDAFIIPNRDDTGTDISDYLVDYDSIETILRFRLK
jgi:endonuclease G